MLRVRVSDLKEGYNSDSDIELFNPKKDLDYRGRVYIRGELRPSLKIVSGRSIIVDGKINKGCSLKSESGNIYVKGSIEGTEEETVLITGKGDIDVQEASVVRCLSVNTQGNVYIDSDVEMAVINTKDNITIHGTVTASRLRSEGQIRLNGCGNGTSECVIEAVPSVTSTNISKTRRIIILRDIQPKTIIVIDGYDYEIREKAFSRVYYVDRNRVVSAPYMWC